MVKISIVVSPRKEEFVRIPRPPSPHAIETYTIYGAIELPRNSKAIAPTTREDAITKKKTKFCSYKNFQRKSQ